MERIWLSQLPSTDPAFGPLQRAERLSDPEDWQVLAFWHRQAVAEAAWGAGLDAMEDRAREKREFAARQAERADDPSDLPGVHAAELEALGYALGLTAVRVAVRDRQQALARAGVAA